MSLCIAAGTASLVLAMQAFTLEWTHSVERTTWREAWQVTAEGLVLAEARIKGSGAGMEPPPEAVLRDGWFVYRPDLEPVARLRLAVSGATAAGWRLCSGSDCVDLETLLPGAAGELVLSACSSPSAGG